MGKTLITDNSSGDGFKAKSTNEPGNQDGNKETNQDKSGEQDKVVIPEGDWRLGLPEDIRTSKTFEKFKGVDGLAKSYIEIEKLSGKAIAKIPGDDAKPEEWNDFYAKLGRPATSKDYKVKAPIIGKDAEGKDIVLDTAALTEMAHEMGLTPRQTQALIDKTGKGLEENTSKRRHEGTEAHKSLSDEWGPNFDANMNRARNALKTFDADGKLLEAIDGTGVGNNPAFIKAFAEIGKLLQEDGLMEGSGGTVAAKSEAEARIAAIKTDKGYWDNSAPNHKALVDEMSRMMRVVHG